MKILYGNKFPEEERVQHVTVVHSNVLGNMRLLVAACDKIVKLSNPALAQSFAKIPDGEDTPLTPEYAKILKEVWNDPGAQATWKRKSEYHIQDALAWYMENIDRLAAPGYIPSVDDILRARVRTSGIVEETYKIDSVDFVMYDVGGQRNERKKCVFFWPRWRVFMCRTNCVACTDGCVFSPTRFRQTIGAQLTYPARALRSTALIW